MRFLLVEDNVELARLLTAGLVAQGLAADVVETAADARLALGSIRYSAMILDLGLPDEDGMNVLKELPRDRDPLPVLVLTARYDRVQGLRAGADDYLVKPFALEELVARLQALMRRPGELLGRSLSIANLVFDTESRQIFVDGRPELFSARKSAVLELLIAGRAAS